MTRPPDDIPTIGASPPPAAKPVPSARGRGVLALIGLVTVALVAFIASTRPGEPVTLQPLPEPSDTPTPTSTPAPANTAATLGVYRMAFDIAPFRVNLPAFAVSEGETSWVFSARDPASGDRYGTGLTARSTTGDKWVEHGVVIAEPFTFWSVDRSSNQFIATGWTNEGINRQVVYTSRDGLSWQPLVPPEGQPQNAVAGSGGVLVATWPGADPRYIEVLTALPDEVRDGVLSGRLSWRIHEPDDAFSVSVGGLTVASYSATDLGLDPMLLVPRQEEGQGGLWLTTDDGSSWISVQRETDPFFPNVLTTLGDGTIVATAWAHGGSSMVALDGPAWVELEGASALGFTGVWNGWYITLRGAEVMASRDLVSWEVIARIPPMNQSLVELSTGPNSLMALHTVDQDLAGIEPTSVYRASFDDYTMTAEFEYGAVTVLRDDTVLVRHRLYSASLDTEAARLEGDFVVLLGPDGEPLMHISIDELGAARRRLDDQYGPKIGVLFATNLHTWYRLEPPFELNPEPASVAVGDDHVVFIERSTDFEPAGVWVGQIEP